MVATMTKRQQDNRIKKIEKEWEEQAHPFHDGIDLFVKYVKRELKDFMNSMMYRQKPKNKVDRFYENFVWWLKIIGIFFMLKGITYWLTGR